MGLLQNISLKYAEPLDRTGDTSEFWPQQLNWGMNKYVNVAGISQKSGVPEGYCPPYSFTIPIKDGGMSSFNQIMGIGTISSGTLAKGVNMPLSTLIGGGGISNIDTSLSLLVQMVAELTGYGEIYQDDTILTAILNMAANVEGSGSINTSPLNLIAWCAASVAGYGSITATMKGWADMSANISSAGDLVTAASCASAVWQKILSNSLSAEDTLLAAGSAGDPWVGEIEAGVNARESLRTLLSILAGKTTITKGTGTTATVKFRDVNDSRDSVVATMNGSQRTNVVLNND